MGEIKNFYDLEAWKKGHKFYYQARGSVAEVQNFLLLAKDLQFIDVHICKEVGEKANEVRRLINGMIKSIENHM